MMKRFMYAIGTLMLHSMGAGCMSNNGFRQSVVTSLQMLQSHQKALREEVHKLRESNKLLESSKFDVSGQPPVKAPTTAVTPRTILLRNIAYQRVNPLVLPQAAVLATCPPIPDPALGQPIKGAFLCGWPSRPFGCTSGRCLRVHNDTNFWLRLHFNEIVVEVQGFFTSPLLGTLPPGKVAWVILPIHQSPGDNEVVFEADAFAGPPPAVGRWLPLTKCKEKFPLFPTSHTVNDVYNDHYISTGICGYRR